MQPRNITFATDQPMFSFPGVMSEAECRQAIARAEKAGFGRTGGLYPPAYRDNDRAVIDSTEWAARLYSRLGRRLPRALSDGAGGRWELFGFNERFRFCRYRDGQRFSIHQDGAFARGPDERSRLTCQVYLNDAADFDGGRTRFYAGRAAGSMPFTGIQAVTGSAIVFDHRLWHDGEAVTRGTKYVMRTDVMYRRTARGEPLFRALRLDRQLPEDLPETGFQLLLQLLGRGTATHLRGHQGYVWSVIVRRDGSLATASRDRTLRTWRHHLTGWTSRVHPTHHGESVTCLAEDEHGRLWSGSRNGWVNVDADGAPSTVGKHEGAVLSLCALPDGRVASAGADGRIRVWSAAGADHSFPAHEGWTWGLAATPDGGLVSCGEDGAVVRWTLAGTRLAERRNGQPVRAVAVSQNQQFAWGMADGTIACSAADLVPRASRRVHSGAVPCLTAIRAGWASGGEDDDAVVLDVELGERRRLPHEGFVRSLVEHPRHGLVTASYDGDVRVCGWAGDEMSFDAVWAHRFAARRDRLTI